jgi:hypothetical protein
MRAIAELTSTKLNWQQRGDFKLDYQLLADGEPAATLRFRSASGSLATAESGDGCWTFKRVGIWQVRVTTRPCGSHTTIASYRYDDRSGTGVLTLSGNRKYLAHTTTRPASYYDFRTEVGEPLVRLNSEGIRRNTASMEILPAAAAVLAEIPWLAMLAWYLTVITYIDAGAFATA